MTNRLERATAPITARAGAPVRAVVLVYQASALGDRFANAARAHLAPERELRIRDWHRGGAPLVNALLAAHRGHVMVGAAEPDLALVIGECIRGAGASLWYEGAHRGRHTGAEHRFHCLPHAPAHTGACPANAREWCEQSFGSQSPREPIALACQADDWLDAVARLMTAIARGAWQPDRATARVRASAGQRYDLESFIYAT
jgi:hypothetical protein